MKNDLAIIPRADIERLRASAEPFFIDVVIAPRDPDAAPYENRRINYNSDGARRWLAKASEWALRNGYTVHTAAAVL